MSRLPNHPATRFTAFAVAVIGVVVGLSAPHAEASIQLGSAFGLGSTFGCDASDSLSFEDLEARLTELSKGEQGIDSQPTDGMSGPSRFIGNGQPEWLVQHFLDQDGDRAPQHAYLSPNSGGAGSSTTSTSSSGGPVGVSLAMLDTSAADLVDDSPLGRYGAERALFLPESQGLDVFRPPRQPRCN